MDEELRRFLSHEISQLVADEENDVQYLMGLISESLEDNESFDSDFERAQWAVAQWCQELRWVPDTREYTTGKTIPPGNQEGREDI
jgi:hypothetical protein